MRKNCETCKQDRLKTPVCDECYNTSDAPTKWEPADHYKPDTNADRIRAMSDEELATDLLDIFEEICEDGVPCKEWMLEWLKQPVE